MATWEATGFTYDDNGNLTGDGVRTYTWNARNQLTALSGPVSATFGYDGFGRRRTKTVGGTATGFLYDGLSPVQELAGGLPAASLVTGLGIDEYFTRTDGAGARHFLADALGSTVALGDGSGAVPTEYTYEPYGDVTTSGTASGNAFTFTGREADGTGLYFYRARYYQPRLQRFVSEDPVKLRAGDPNFFQYVGNSPLNRVDPDGRQYVDVNASGILPNGFGGTAGGMTTFCGAEYPYLGVSAGTPGANLSGTASASSPSTGINVTVTGIVPTGVGRGLVFQWGYGADGMFWETGAAIGPPGLSASAYYAWQSRSGSCDNDRDRDDRGGGDGAGGSDGGNAGGSGASMAGRKPSE